ncbi:hypothetical protein [Agromyces sp. NPDC058104]|uniref:hypothetical protein n=1 Tax=Agromyces sp. NPDC058104 TaxID=3346342 RepID=UPI0036D7E052
MTIPADDQSTPGLPGAAEPESRAARRSAELGGTLRPRRMPDRASVWAPPAPEQGGAAVPPQGAGSSLPAAPASAPASAPAAAPGQPAAAPAEIERYYLCCEVPSGDFVEVILAVSDGGRRRYFTTSDGDRLAEVDEYYFVRRSLGDARSMLELDAREMAQLEAELNFVRPLRGRDPLAELAAESAGEALASEVAAADATGPTTPAGVVAETGEAPSPVEALPTEVPPVAGQVAAEVPHAEPAPLASSSEPSAAPETDAEAWVELLRRAGFEPPELNLDPLEPEPAPASHPDALMVEPVLMQWAETIDRQPDDAEPAATQAQAAHAAEPGTPAAPTASAPANHTAGPAIPGPTVDAESAGAVEPPRAAEPAPIAAATAAAEPASGVQPDPTPEIDAATHVLPEPAASAPLTPPKLSLVPVPPVVSPVPPTPRLSLVPGPPPEPIQTPAPAFPPAAEATPETVAAPDAAPASDHDSNEETNPVAMMTNPTDALAPAASVTPIAAPALHSAPAPAVDADAAAQVALAKGIAFVAHRGQVDQVGADYIDHPGRVAEHFDAATEPTATAAAWLHDVIERSAVSEQELLEAGVRPDIVEVVLLLTRTPEMSDDAYFARIRTNPLARRVKLADVADNSAPWRLRKLDYDAQQRLAAKYRHAREALG